MSISNNIIVNESGLATHIQNYKIVILGDQYVGKTSILNKYKYETVEDGYAVKNIKNIKYKIFLIISFLISHL